MEEKVNKDDAKDDDKDDAKDDAKEQYIVLSCLPFVKPVISAAEGFQNYFVRNSFVHFAVDQLSPTHYGNFPAKQL